MGPTGTGATDRLWQGMPEREPEKIVAEAIERHAKGDPAALAVAIIERLWEAGYEIRPRPDIAEVRNKLAVLRGHCDAASRDYDTIEKTRVQAWLLARDDAEVVAKRERLTARGPLRGFVGTVSEAIDLIGQYQDAGINMLINSDQRNDVESRELFASDVMPHFA